MSLEMAHKVIVPPKKNYIPQFLKQRDINSYFVLVSSLCTTTRITVKNTIFPVFDNGLASRKMALVTMSILPAYAWPRTALFSASAIRMPGCSLKNAQKCR
jgi:hypothetical protein